MESKYAKSADSAMLEESLDKLANKGLRVLKKNMARPTN
jgi:hypothetical protein